ncbi:hypothetical protein AAMO2058_001454100 [Amorphochlora amoebiformis]
MRVRYPAGSRRRLFWVRVWGLVGVGMVIFSTEFGVRRGGRTGVGRMREGGGRGEGGRIIGSLDLTALKDLQAKESLDSDDEGSGQAPEDHSLKLADPSDYVQEQMKRLAEITKFLPKPKPKITPKPKYPASINITTSGNLWKEYIDELTREIRRKRVALIQTNKIQGHDDEINKNNARGPSRRYGLIDASTGRRIVLDDDPRDHIPGSVSLDHSLKSWISRIQKERQFGVYDTTNRKLPPALQMLGMGGRRSFAEVLRTLPDAPNHNQQSLPPSDLAHGMLRGMGYNGSTDGMNRVHRIVTPSPWIGRRGVGSTAPFVNRWNAPTAVSASFITSAAHFNTSGDGMSGSFLFETQRQIDARERREILTQTASTKPLTFKKDGKAEGSSESSSSTTSSSSESEIVTEIKTETGRRRERRRHRHAHHHHHHRRRRRQRDTSKSSVRRRNL